MIFFLKKWLGSPSGKDLPNEAEGAEVKDNLTAIIKMYNLRRTVDIRLAGKKSGKNILPHQLWETPEAMIANATALCEALKDDGYSEEQSIQKMRNLLKKTHKSDDGKDCADLISYLKSRLETVDPLYLLLGDDILKHAVEIANNAARIEIDDRKQRNHNENPSDEWIIEKIPYNGIFNDSVHKSEEERKYKQFYSLFPVDDYEGKRSWLRFQIRAREGDEIWMYLAPSFLHAEKAVLVRDGKIIDEIRAETPFISFSYPKQ